MAFYYDRQFGQHTSVCSDRIIYYSTNDLSGSLCVIITVIFKIGHIISQLDFILHFLSPFYNHLVMGINKQLQDIREILIYFKEYFWLLL